MSFTHTHTHTHFQSPRRRICARRPARKHVSPAARQSLAQCFQRHVQTSAAVTGAAKALPGFHEGRKRAALPHVLVGC